MKYNTIDELGEIRRRRGVAYYHQLYTLLTVALSDGAIPPGSALPSETELMERFQVSRNTVRRAFARLEQEKRIIRRRGSGTYARSVPQPKVSSDAIALALQDSDATGMHAPSRLLRIQMGATPEFIRRRDANFGAQSLLVQRSRSFDDVPFLVSTSYVPEMLAARLTRRLLTRQSVLTALVGIGTLPKTADQTITAMAADSFTARHLGVEVAAAVLCIHRLIRDAESRAIEHQSHLLNPDRCHLDALLTIERSQNGMQWLDPQPRQLPAFL
jgi:GntR family transcriptional regulator